MDLALAEPQIKRLSIRYIVVSYNYSTIMFPKQKEKQVKLISELSWPCSFTLCDPHMASLQLMKNFFVPSYLTAASAILLLGAD